MIIDDSHYDVIIIGSGAGGGTLAGALSRKGHSVLMLERGEAMALEDQNVADVDLFRKDRYHPKNERAHFRRYQCRIGGNLIWKDFQKALRAENRY